MRYCALAAPIEQPSVLASHTQLIRLPPCHGTTWSENLVIITPQERHPESAVKISPALTGIIPVPHALTFATQVVFGFCGLLPPPYM
jgi:hypothetical protein